MEACQRWTLTTTKYSIWLKRKQVCAQVGCTWRGRGGRFYRARTESISLKPKKQKTCTVGFSFFFFTLCIHMCLLCVVYVRVHMVCAHVRVCVEASSWIKHLSPPFYFLTVWSLNLELTNSTRLAGQWVSEINLSLFPFCPDLGLWIHWLLHGHRELNSGFIACTTDTWLTGPSSQW